MTPESPCVNMSRFIFSSKRTSFIAKLRVPRWQQRWPAMMWKRVHTSIRSTAHCFASREKEPICIVSSCRTCRSRSRTKFCVE